MNLSIPGKDQVQFLNLNDTCEGDGATDVQSVCEHTLAE